MRSEARILLVEDDPGDQELTRRAFEQCSVECELFVVGDGEEAFDYLTRRGNYVDQLLSPRPKLILLDLNLPKLNGRDLLKKIRSQSAISHIPVVILTTSSQDEDVILSYKAGANSFITKSVDMNDFFKTINSLSEYWFKTVVLPKRDL